MVAILWRGLDVLVLSGVGPMQAKGA